MGHNTETVIFGTLRWRVFCRAILRTKQVVREGEGACTMLVQERREPSAVQKAGPASLPWHRGHRFEVDRGPAIE